jgi:hypothetical protein
MAVQGVFASDQNIPSSRRGDFASGILQTMPTGSAPLLALTAGMESQGATDTVVTWFEENHLSGRINVTNNAASGTSFVVDDASQVIAGLVYLVETSGEYIYVESVAGSTVTVTRGFGGTTITALDGSVTAEPIQRITNAQEEGSGKPTAIANLGFPRFNYMQIFRNAWDVTGTARVVDYHTGDIVAKNKRDAGIYHSEDIERAMIWGKQAIGVQNGKPFRTMAGMQSQITTNVVAQGANTTWTEIDQFLMDVFARNIKGKPNERIAFCGNTVLQVLNTIARTDGNLTQINLTPGQTDFGMKITKWMTPYGDISLLTHPLFNESPIWTKDLMVLHPGAMRTRYLRKTFEDMNDKNGTRAGADSDFGVVTTEMCMEYRSEITGGLFTGIDTAAAG